MVINVWKNTFYVVMFGVLFYLQDIWIFKLLTNLENYVYSYSRYTLNFKINVIDLCVLFTNNN